MNLNLLALVARKVQRTHHRDGKPVGLKVLSSEWQAPSIQREVVAAYFDITRAARRAGVSRQEIQKRIADGDLESFEGKVPHEALVRLYPRASATPPGMVEFVAEVKEAALAKSPSRDVENPGAAALPGLYREMLASRNRAEALAADRLALLRQLERLLTDVENDGASPQRLSAALHWLRTQLRSDGIR
jgi:hypothetical protein